MNRDRIVERAEKLAAAGKIEAAIQEYEALIRFNPNDVITLNRIGDLRARMGHNHSAVAVFKKIADHYLREGFFLKAIAILKKVSRLEPNDLSIYERLADLYARQGLTVEARAQYAVVAESYSRRGQLVDALEAYRKTAELDPADVDAATRVAELYAQVGRSEESENEYRRVVLQALRRSGPAEVLRVARSAMKFHPLGGELARWTGEVLVEQKQLTLAITLLQEVFNRADVQPEAIIILGRALVASGDLEHAREVFERGLALYPENEHIRKNVAGLALLEGDSDRALNLVGAFASHDGDEEVAADLAPVSFEPLHDPDLLTEERLAEADVYASYGLSLPAIALIEQVLADYPDYPPALERLLRLALFDDRADEAVQIGTRILPILYRDGLRDEARRVEDELRRRDLLASVLAVVELPEMPPQPTATTAEFALVSDESFGIDLEVEDETDARHPDTVAESIAAPETSFEEAVAAVPEAASEAAVTSVPEAAPEAPLVAPPEEIAAPDDGTQGNGAITEQIDDVQRLIARRKITRATKLLDELLLEYPDEPRLQHIRDGLRARKQAGSRKRTRPGETLARALREDPDELEVN